jgi:O-acetyl-ADP-ribose deacetylase (regulator of RNase III)
MSEIIDRLLEILCDEKGYPHSTMKGENKDRHFRMLCNVRPPEEVSEEFLTLQDKYLSEKTREKGVVDVNDFKYDDYGITMWRGDITRLKSDAIVNACNSSLLGCFQPLHNCIDNAIHSAAGVQVRLDCNRIMGGKLEKNGQVKVTKGYNLPAKYIFHTVGPQIGLGVARRVTEQEKADLKSCYLSCLDKAVEMGLESIVFCCISTGVYGFPSELACEIAVTTVSQYLKEKRCNLKVVFDVFNAYDEVIYAAQLKKLRG